MPRRIKTFKPAAPAVITPETVNSATIAQVREDAVLVDLSIGEWRARRFDAPVTQQTTKAHNAEDGSGHFHKSLMSPRAYSFKALINHMANIRTKLNYETLPWVEDGVRVLAKNNIERYQEKVAEGQATMRELLETVIAEYDDLKLMAKEFHGGDREHGGMYDEMDYPTIATLRAKFYILAEYGPVPNAESFPASLRALLEGQLETRVQRAINIAATDAWQRLYDVIDHMHERLSKPGAILRGDLVGDIRDVVSVLGRLNVMRDTRLEDMARESLAKLAKYDQATLRESEGARAEVAKDAGSIMAAIRGTRIIRVRREEAAA